MASGAPLNSGRLTPFQPPPYLPLANRPTDNTPHRPLTPWTEMAPTGSSIPSFSQKKTLRTTRTPATAPMMAAPMLPKKAHGAVIATSPASIPLQSIDVSGLSPLAHMVHIDDRQATIPATMV